jgi:hypothetical protein
MITRPIRTLLCFLAPLVAGADTLDVYGSLTGKTVLMASGLHRLPDSIVAGLSADKTNAIARIERALAEHGVEVVQDGPNFVRIFRREARESLTNAPLRGAELAPLNGQETAGPETVAPGMVNFGGADLNQVLEIYAALSQRTVLRPATLPLPLVHLKNEVPLTREEVGYAVEKAFELNGICVVDDGAKFVQAVPGALRAQVKTNAPKPEPGAKLFDPEKVPALGFAVIPGPQTAADRNPAQRLLEFYADLAGKTAVPEPEYERASIWFYISTPLSKSDLLYAIETTFALNGFAIIPVDDQGIRLDRLSSTGK